MAAKKTTGKRRSSAEPSLQQQAERLQASLGESAQQIWLAGLGAFNRAQTEGGKLFDTLVREGSKVEQRAGRAREDLADGVQDARSRASDTFGRMDQAFRTRVGDALKALEVPTRRELGALVDKVDALNQKLRAHNTKPTTGTKARKAAARTAAASPSRPAAKKAATKKVARKTAAPKPSVEPASTPAAASPTPSASGGTEP